MLQHCGGLSGKPKIECLLGFPWPQGERRVPLNALCCPLFPEVAFCHIRAARCSLYFPPLRFYFLLASFSVCGLQLEGGIVSCREDGLDWKERRENIGGPQKSGTHSAGFLEQSSSRLWLGCKD